MMRTAALFVTYSSLFGCSQAFQLNVPASRSWGRAESRTARFVSHYVHPDEQFEPEAVPAEVFADQEILPPQGKQQRQRPTPGDKMNDEANENAENRTVAHALDCAHQFLENINADDLTRTFSMEMERHLGEIKSMIGEIQSPNAASDAVENARYMLDTIDLDSVRNSMMKSIQSAVSDASMLVREIDVAPTSRLLGETSGTVLLVTEGYIRSKNEGRYGRSRSLEEEARALIATSDAATTLVSELDHAMEEQTQRLEGELHETLLNAQQAIEKIDAAQIVSWVMGTLDSYFGEFHNQLHVIEDTIRSLGQPQYHQQQYNQPQNHQDAYGNDAYGGYRDGYGYPTAGGAQRGNPRDPYGGYQQPNQQGLTPSQIKMMGGMRRPQQQQQQQYQQQAPGIRTDALERALAEAQNQLDSINLGVVSASISAAVEPPLMTARMALQQSIQEAKRSVSSAVESVSEVVAATSEEVVLELLEANAQAAAADIAPSGGTELVVGSAGDGEFAGSAQNLVSGARSRRRARRVSASVVPEHDESGVGVDPTLANMHTLVETLNFKLVQARHLLEVASDISYEGDHAIDSTHAALTFSGISILIEASQKMADMRSLLGQSLGQIAPASKLFNPPSH